MGPSDFSDLGSQLHRIYTGKSEDLPLDAFNEAVCSVFKGRQRRICNTMREIEKELGKIPSPQEISEQRKRFDEIVSVELLGSIEKKEPYLTVFDEKSNEVEMVHHRVATVAFHQATHVFWSMFIENRAPSSLEKLIEGKKSLLKDLPLYNALKKEGVWMQLEGVMQLPIPVTLFSKLKNREILKIWVNRLNDQKSISSDSFWNILHEALRIIELEGSSAITFQDLLYQLENAGCTILQREDDLFMSWREKLQPGSEIACNGKKWTLGPLLGPLKKVDDQFKVFALDDNHVIKISNNRFRFFIDDKKAELEHWGFRLVEKVSLDSEGRCVILERLSAPISCHNWTSQSALLTPEDERIALIFANHLYCMNSWDGNAENLSLDHLGFDSQGCLKSTRLLKKGFPNYNDLELHCVQLAKGNPQVLRFLMTVSQLSQHEVGLHYREAIKYAFMNGETNLVSCPFPVGYRSVANYDERIKKLCQQALNLRESCLKHVTADLRKGENRSLLEKNLSKLVGERLVYFYTASPTPGVMADSQLQEEVVNSVLDGNWKELVLNDYSDYYQERFNFMIQCNLAAQNDLTKE